MIEIYIFRNNMLHLKVYSIKLFKKSYSITGQHLFSLRLCAIFFRIANITYWLKSRLWRHNPWLIALKMMNKGWAFISVLRSYKKCIFVIKSNHMSFLWRIYLTIFDQRHCKFYGKVELFFLFYGDTKSWYLLEDQVVYLSVLMYRLSRSPCVTHHFSAYLRFSFDWVMSQSMIFLKFGAPMQTKNTLWHRNISQNASPMHLPVTEIVLLICSAKMQIKNIHLDIDNTKQHNFESPLSKTDQIGIIWVP
jgi:hypothetical protein